MKLIYRGKSHESSTPFQLRSGFIDQPSFKLIYRGNIYNYTPRHIMISEADTTNWPTATLIYRGNTYHRKLQPPTPYQKSRAINWRWKWDAPDGVR